MVHVEAIASAALENNALAIVIQNLAFALRCQPSLELWHTRDGAAAAPRRLVPAGLMGRPRLRKVAIMTTTLPQYVTQESGVYRVAGTRVSLDSLVCRFLEGRSPECIQQSFPTLTLEQVYGALTYYLAHRAEIDAYLAQQDAAFETARQQFRATHGALVGRLLEARRRQQAGPS